MEYVIAHWEYFLLGFMIAEKIVKITPFKWDDILIDGLKEVFQQIPKMFKTGKSDTISDVDYNSDK